MAGEFGIGLTNEQVGKKEEVGTALAEFRHIDCELAYTVIEVFTEASFAYRCLQILIGRTHKAYIHSGLLCTADGADTTFLQCTQQLHLNIITQVAHLIKEQCAAIGSLKSTYFVVVGTGECTLLVTEELRCRHITGYGSAVESIERL